MGEGKATERKQRRRNHDPERVTVIGLGRFGSSTARTLHDLGYEVTAIDIAEKPVAEIASFVTLAAQGDSTDETLLRSLAVDESDFAVVAQGENLEANTLSTMLLKRLGVPWVIAKAVNPLHGELLRLVGADRVIFPEIDAGVRLAHSIGVRNITDYIELTRNSGAAKLSVPQHLVGKTVETLAAPFARRFTILLIKRDEMMIVRPSADEVIQRGDVLLVVGEDRDIDTFAENPTERQ